MQQRALFVRHRTKPGMRPRMQAIWAEYVKPRVEANSDHLAYFFCLDAQDEDVVSVFQLFRTAEAVQAFMAGAWYPEYLAAVSEVVMEAPVILEANPSWIKGLAAETN
ncbi:MAG: putative quinol monooxygenase [Planctomycetota bacterium]